MEERSVAKFPELSVMFGMNTSHGFDHLFTEFHGWRQRFRIASEDVTEIDVEELARLGQHQIIQMAITNAEKVRDDTIASYRIKKETSRWVHPQRDTQYLLILRE